MQKFHRNITLERFDKFTSSQYFQDVNLYARLYRQRSGDAVTLSVSGDAGMNRMYAPSHSHSLYSPFEQAVKGHFRPSKVGESFGPSWATFWFRVRCVVPDIWRNHPIHFLWDANNEGLIYTLGTTLYAPPH